MNKLKFYMVAAAMGALSACSSLDTMLDPIGAGMFTGSMDTTWEIMSGTGKATRLPDGKTVFTFVIHESATAYFEKNDVKGKEDFRLHQLGSWVSKAKECPNGYEMKKLAAAVQDLHAYEGVCK